MGAVAQRNMLRFVKKNPSVITSVTDKDIFFSVLLAIASDESGYGTSNAAKNRNNFFGIGNGQTSFNSAKEAFEFQASLFYDNPYLKNKVTSASTPYEQIRRIADSGYYQMDNDGSLDKKYTGDAVWNQKKQRWIKQNGDILRFPLKQSYDKYYNTLKGFVDDALTAIPVGKITSKNQGQILASI